MTTDQRFPNIFSTEKALKKFISRGIPTYENENTAQKQLVVNGDCSSTSIPCFTPVCFSLFPLTPLTNLHHFSICVLSFSVQLGWPPHIPLTAYFLIGISLFIHLSLIYARFFFSGTQSGRKTKTGCTSNCQKNIPQYFDGYLEISFSRTSKFLFSHSAVLVEALTTFCETLVWEHRSRTITASKSHTRPYRMQLQAVHSLSDSASNVFYCYALTRHFTSHNHWPESAKAITGTSDEPQAIAHNQITENNEFRAKQVFQSLNK